MFRITPTTRKKIQKFKSIKRGYYSLIILTTLIVLSAFAELYVNNRAIVVKYEGKYYFPTYSSIIPGNTFGLDYNYETNYRDLKEQWKDDPDNYVIMPFIPYNPYELDYNEKYKDENGNKLYHPLPPSIKNKHFLGTDKTARDILARLIYAFRTAMVFALLVVLVTVIIGASVGLLMGYLGGIYDLLGIRLLEIFGSIPALYAIIILSSIISRDIVVFFFLFVIFSWIGWVADIRSMTFREKTIDYIAAARAMGAKHPRLIFRHILPNVFVVLLVMIPFAINTNITALTSFGYLGFGLLPPTPSIGELLQQGQAFVLDKPWILASTVSVLVVLLVMVTFIGEALREAFDPKRHTVYE